MKSKNILLFALVAVLFAGIGVFVNHQLTPPKTPQDLALESLLEQTLSDVSGKPQKLSQWKGKPLVINFWATWCGPCVEEMPELSALQKEIAPVQILGIGVDSQANMAKFAEKLQIHYPLYVAGPGATDMLRQFGNAAGGLPFTVLVGLDGKLKKIYLGRLDFKQLRTDLAALKND